MYCFAGAITSPQWGTRCARLAKVVFNGNALPDDIRVSNSLASFRKQIKTYLYTKAYPLKS